MEARRSEGARGETGGDSGLGSRTPLVVLPLLVLVLGLMIDLVWYQAAGDDARRETRIDLERDAGELSHLLRDAVDESITQTEAAAALFRASDLVTGAEFSEFVDAVGSWPVSRFWYVQPVPGSDLPAYLARVQATEPGYQVFEYSQTGHRPVTSRSQHLPVRFGVSRGDLPDEVGFDLASDPVLRAAVAQALRGRGPVVTELTIRGDATPGDMAVVAPINGSAGDVIGMVVATVQLDEGLFAQAPAMVSPGVRWSFEHLHLDAGDAPEELRGPLVWQGVVHAADSAFLVRMTASPTALDSALADRLPTFFLGLLATLLAALAFYTHLSRRRSAEEVALLHRLSDQKDRFIAGVSHELRTPLTSVLGILSVLAGGEERPGPELADELLPLALQEASDLADLVEDLLTAGRLQNGSLSVARQSVDLEAELRRVLDRAHPAGRVRVDFPEDLRVSADPLRVRQILRNLVSNAIRYGGSTIDCVARPGEGGVVLEVRNDGPAVPAEFRERIFEPFATGGARPTQPDSIGLGLSVSRLLARAMDGDLRYRHADGFNVFSLELRLDPAPAKPEPAQL